VSAASGYCVIFVLCSSVVVVFGSEFEVINGHCIEKNEVNKKQKSKNDSERWKRIQICYKMKL
jgi:hypothetical protein